MDYKEFLNQSLLKIKNAQNELLFIDSKLKKRPLLKKIFGSSIEKSQEEHLKNLIESWQTDVIIATRKHLNIFDKEYNNLANENIHLLTGLTFRLDFTDDYNDSYDLFTRPKVLAQRSPWTAGYFEGELTANKISFKSKPLKSIESNGIQSIATHMEGYINYLGHCFLKPTEGKKHLRPSHYEAKIGRDGKMEVISIGDTLTPMHRYGFNILYGDIFKNNIEKENLFFANVDRLQKKMEEFKKSNNIDF